MGAEAGRGRALNRIRNLYHMLAYAFSVLNKPKYRALAAEDFDNAAELCAAILERGVSLQLKRGLGQEYVNRTEARSSLRGKIEVTESVKSQALLRRRFAFVELRPAFDSDGFREYCAGLDNPRFEALVREVESLNRAIAEDESLGEGFCIGHSYFCNMKRETCTDAALASIVEYELIPMLKEYWFDEPGKVREWSDRLRRSLR